MTESRYVTMQSQHTTGQRTSAHERNYPTLHVYKCITVQSQTMHTMQNLAMATARKAATIIPIIIRMILY